MAFITETIAKCINNPCCVDCDKPKRDLCISKAPLPHLDCRMFYIFVAIIFLISSPVVLFVQSLQLANINRKEGK